jgi:predicted small secreted protein
MNLAKLLLLLMVASFTVTACDMHDSAAENAGEAIDVAGEKIAEAATDAGNAIEDACEDVKESVDAEDTDC